MDAANDAKALMAKLKESFPPDMDYVVALDTTLAVTEGMKEIVSTRSGRRCVLVIIVVVHLPAGLARDADSAGGRAGIADRHVRRLPAVRFLGQHALAVRPGAGHRPGGGRRDRGGRSREHHIEEGLVAEGGGAQGDGRSSGPVIAIALILAAVFIPTAFIPGITGRLYQQFAVTIAVSVIISAFNALTLSPALAALLLRPK